MFKRILAFTVMISFLSGLFAAPSRITVDKVEPPYWWTGMHQDTLQIMLYGPNIGDAKATLSYLG